MGKPSIDGWKTEPVFYHFFKRRLLGGFGGRFLGGFNNVLWPAVSITMSWYVVRSSSEHLRPITCQAFLIRCKIFVQ